MKSSKDIERLAKNIRIKKNAVNKDRILAGAQTALKELKETESTYSKRNIWRIIMQSKKVKLSAAAIIIVAIILGINFIGTPIDGASTAFAAAIDSIIRARTFSCTTISEMPYEKDGKYGNYLSKEKVMFKEPDRERRVKLTSPWPEYIGETDITHYDKRQRLILRPTEKTATLYDLSSEYYIDDETYDLKLTQLNTRLRDYLLELSAGAIEDLGSVELEGQSVRLLRSCGEKRTATVWIDPLTGYPVQVELTWTDQNRSPVMFTSIEIDTELDDDLFSLEPPEGYDFEVFTGDWPDDKSKIGTKIKHLGVLCIIYANDNADQFPADLKELVTIGLVTDDELNKLLAESDNPDSPPVIKYRKPKTVGNDDWSTEIALYEIYEQWPDSGIVVGFADGHSEIIADQNRFEELIK